MTNINSVIRELAFMLGIDEIDATKYEDTARSSAQSIKQILKDESSIDDVRIIHLCAVKAFYKISLFSEDNISSFSAGDVSYTKKASATENAKKLLDDALKDCKDLIKNTDFTFKVV